MNTAQPTDQRPIREIRRLLQMTQPEFAAAIGRSSQLIVCYESRPDQPHHVTPSPDAAFAIQDLMKARGMTVSLEQIYGRAPIDSEAIRAESMPIAA